jgi:hypothetical protein
MIATRMLKIKDEDEFRDMPICIFEPEEQGGSWSCRYEIDWPEGRESREIWGIDPVQALLLACQMIGAELYTSDYHKSDRLMFHEPGQGYGFPVPESLRHLLIGNDRKYGA